MQRTAVQLIDHALPVGLYSPAMLFPPVHLVG